MGATTSVPVPYVDPGQHPTRARLGYSTALQRGVIPSGWDGTLEAIDDWEGTYEVRDISGPDLSRDTVDVTNHRSPNFAVETIPALSSTSTATFTVNFVPDLYGDPDTPEGRLYADFQGENVPWRIVFAERPDAAGARSIKFLASVTGYSFNIPVADAMTLDIELTISGGIQWYDADDDIVPFAAAIYEAPDRDQTVQQTADQQQLQQGQQPQQQGQQPPPVQGGSQEADDE